MHIALCIRKKPVFQGVELKKTSIPVANTPLPANQFLVDLNASLSRHVDLLQDHEALWNMQGECDVVLLHYLEYMTYKNEH